MSKKIILVLFPTIDSGVIYIKETFGLVTQIKKQNNNTYICGEAIIKVASSARHYRGLAINKVLFSNDLSRNEYNEILSLVRSHDKIKVVI